MQQKYKFEKKHCMLCNIWVDLDTLFCGFLTIFSKDFAQILPIIKNGDYVSIANTCNQKFILW